MNVVLLLQFTHHLVVGAVSFELCTKKFFVKMCFASSPWWNQKNESFFFSSEASAFNQAQKWRSNMQLLWDVNDYLQNNKAQLKVRRLLYHFKF